MANWSYNIYAVKSATKNVLNFVNEGLKNKGIEPMDNIEKAIEKLWETNNVTMETFRPMPETFYNFDTKRSRGAIDYDTKEPLFKSDEEYETYCKEYDNAVKYQKETYGVVGWYDYNRDVALGCKWNTEVELESYEVEEEKGATIIYMRGETPWRYPYLWLDYIKETFSLNVFLYAREEANFYHFFKEWDGDVVEGYEDYENILENVPIPDNFEDDDTYDDAYWTFMDTVCDCGHFYEYVKKAGVDVLLDYNEEPLCTLF